MNARERDDWEKREHATIFDAVPCIISLIWKLKIKKLLLIDWNFFSSFYKPTEFEYHKKNVSQIIALRWNF